MMYMTRPAQAVSVPPVPLPAVIALGGAAIAVVYLGILPARVIEWASRSIATIF
jgi:NADH:ubiquinone oxidoreductase subunit 2 (subunit N)